MHGAACLVREGHLWIFGGHRPKKTIYALNLETEAWKAISVQGDIPVRCRPCFIEHGNHCYIFGGESLVSGNKNSFHKFDFETLTWHKILSQDPPSERSGAVSAVYNHQLYIFGGWGGGSIYLRDMYRIALGFCHSPSPSPLLSEHISLLFIAN